MNNYLKSSLKLLWAHVLFIILSFFLMYILGWLINKENGIITFSYITSILYFLMVYSDSWEFGRKESKSYSTIKAYPMKGLVLGLLASSISIIITIVFYVAKFTDNNFIIINIIYRVWMSMFIGFFESYGEILPHVFALVLIVLPVASFLGYLAGMKNFSIQAKIMPIMYKKVPKK